MRRRRKKSPPFRNVLLWTLSLALIAWGLWQANQLRLSLNAPPPFALAATSQPDLLGTDAAGHSDPAIINVNATQPLLGTPPISSEVAVPAAHLQPTPVFEPALSATDLFAQGTAALNAGQTLAARFALNEALARTTDDSQAAQLRLTLAALNRPIFLGSQILPADPAARFVLIQPGDNYFLIARAYGINAAFLQILNPTLNPNNLKPNTGIKIVQGPFHARIIKHAARLDLYARDLYLTSFPVDFPEGNLLPRGDYLVSPGTKLQLPVAASATRTSAPVKTWIGFQGLEPATDAVSNGWLFASAGPRGADPRNRATGIHLTDADLQQLYNTLTESRSHLRVEP